MASFSNTAKNNKSLTNETMTDITVEEATMTVEEAERPVQALGKPITKFAINEKSLSNLSEHI